MADTIKGIIGDVILGLEQQKKLTLEEILKVWKQAAGAKAFKHTRPTSLRRGKLVVEVEGAPWLYDLNLRRASIIERLNKNLDDPKKKISSIHFRVGDI